MNILNKPQIQNFLNTSKGDFLGGVLASIIALPQALAFGVATGLGAQAGLWGAIILSLVEVFKITSSILKINNLLSPFTEHVLI